MMAAVVERSAPLDDLDVVRRVGEPADELTWLRTIEVAPDRRRDVLCEPLASLVAGGGTDEAAVRADPMVGGSRP